MNVVSNNDEVNDLRKGVVELLMSEHPHGCLTCHRTELCGPQDICQRHVSVTDRCTICPKNDCCPCRTSPLPPHSGQFTGDEPGAEPLPWQSSQGPHRLIFTVFSISAPRRGNAKTSRISLVFHRF